MCCERNNGCGCEDRCDYNCPNDRRVFKHRHIVKHRHDEVHEYDVIHQHDHHIYDVVRVREEHKHHDHRKHRPDYCHNGGCIDNGGNGDVGIEIVNDNCCCE
jgi:hypothetical protein